MLNFCEGRRDLTYIAPDFDRLKSKIKGIVFDIDGTLTDSIMQVVECTYAAFAALNLPKPEEDAVKGIIGKQLQEGLTSLLPLDLRDRYGADLARVYREIFKREERFYRTVLFAGVEPMLAHLKDAGFKLGFASGKSTLGIKRVLEESPLGLYAQVFAAGDEVPSKPDPAMIFKVAERLQLDPGSLLGVGDAGMDIQMYQNAGAFACGVQTGSWSGSALASLHPQLLLPAAADLKAIF